MRPTRPGVLVLCAVLAAVGGYLLAELAYGSLPPLPRYAPVTLVLLGIVELGMARVVSDRVRGRSRPGARPVHPLQVARAVALAKASSPTGSLLLGLYLGLLVWLLPREAAQAREDALICAGSALGALLLVVGALLLERACRTPDDREPGRGLGSRA